MLVRVFFAVCLAFGGTLAPALGPAKAITVAQISDTHIGLEDNAPHAEENLKRVVELVNARHPDAVIVSGDVGENTEARTRARAILANLNAKVYFVPGNHDVTADTVDKWRRQFGPDYYEFQVGNISFLAVDSQLLGNYNQFTAKKPAPLSSQGAAESEKMLAWLKEQAHNQHRDRPIFVVQHIPPTLGGGIPENRPYWTTQEPYRSLELELLHRLGVRHMFAGHWHLATVFAADGLTYHIAPATSWSPFGSPLGFALHTITPGGDVTTTFISLSGETFANSERISTKPIR
ncbi:MAG: metallophosphoesterase family protein [Terriglobales bacterium]